MTVLCRQNKEENYQLDYFCEVRQESAVYQTAEMWFS